MSTTIAEFIEQAWNDHVTDLAGTAARIEPELSQLADAPDQVGAFAQLAEQTPRTAPLDTLMMDAALTSRSAWSKAGTWLTVERADYMLARCAAALGEGVQAVAHALSCLAICEANDAEPVELFFAHE